MTLSFAIDGQPEFSLLTVDLPAEEMIRVEASAMSWMSSSLKLKTRAKGGLSRLMTGENLFINEFSTADGGEIGIAPSSPGDIGHYSLQGENIYLQNSAFLAATSEVDLSTKWQGLIKGMFSGSGLFLIKASGFGDLWFNSYGSLIKIDNPSDGFIVDTDHLVAFTDGLDYSVRGLGNYRSLFFSGEGLVCRLRGQGSIWVQSHKVSALSWWLRPFRRVKRRKGDN